MRRYLYSEDSGLYMPERNVQPWDGRACNWVSAGSCGSCGSIGGTQSIFRPDDLLVGATGLFADLDAAGAVTRNTQPSVVNGDFETGNTNGWTSEGGATLSADNTTPRSGTYCGKSVGNAINDGFLRAQADLGLVSGNRYSFNGYGAGDGTCQPGVLIDGAAVDWLGTTSAAWQNAACERTCTLTFGMYLVDRSGAVGFTRWDDVSLVNLSVSSVTCKGNLGNLVQATAANMPNDSDASAPTSVLVNGRHVLYFDGKADYVASAAAASTFPFHKSAGFSCVFAYKPTTGAEGTDTIVDTCNATNTNVGITIEYDAGNAQIVVKVANGSGTFVVDKGTGAASVPANAWSRVTVTWTEAAGVSIRVDEDAADTDASVGAASAADATATLQVGRTSGGANFIHGALHGFLIRVGAISDAQCLQWLAYEKAWLGL